MPTQGDTPLTPTVDPAFAPPPAPEHAPEPFAHAPVNPPAPVSATTLENAPAPSAPVVPATSDVVDTGMAIPIEAPPTGTPVHIEAAKQAKAGDVYTLDGDILILYKSYRVRADHATYNAATSTVEASGNVMVDGGPSDEHLVADHGTMNLEAHTAHFYTATGTLGVRSVTHDRYVFTAPNPFALSGDEVLELGPGRYQVLRGTLTSCRLPDPDWKLLARNILIDGNVAHARNSTFTLFGAPLVFLPYVSHPVEQNHRQSGVLLPIFGNDTQKGFISGESVYLVLGRSADATLGAEYFSRRGFNPFGQLRYRGFGENFASLRFRALFDRLPAPNNQGGQDIFADGRRELDAHTRAAADIEYLSSYVYRQAFEENYSAAINSEVKSSAYVTREENAYAANAHFERYQNFRGTAPGDEIRVLHTPELQLDGLDQPLGRTPFLWGGMASASALSRSEPGFQTSRLTPRLDLYPHLALPLSGGGWHLRGEAGVRETFYAKSQLPGAPGALPVESGASLNRAAFIGDAELHPPVLERDFAVPWLGKNGGGALRHTVEPYLHYHYVTGVNHFAETLRFDLTDVLADTNEVDYGLTQRLFVRGQGACPPGAGPGETHCGTADWLTWTVLQRHYFNPTFGGAVVAGQRNVFTSTLDLTGIAFLAAPRNNSPIISRLRLRTTGATDLEWDLDYDGRSGRVQGSNLLASYRVANYFFSVGDARLVNLVPQTPALPNAPSATGTTQPGAQRNFNQLRVAAIYGSPTKHGLSAGANLGYDFAFAQTQYLGVETGYNRDCCGVAFEMRRYSLGNPSTNSVIRDDTQYLFSFTLAGVGSAGSLRPVLRVF